MKKITLFFSIFFVFTFYGQSIKKKQYNLEKRQQTKMYLQLELLDVIQLNMKNRYKENSKEDNQLRNLKTGLLQ